MDECLICGGRGFSPYAAGVYGRDLALCESCGLVVTSPRPSPEELLPRYGPEYYAHWISPEQRQRREGLWRRRARRVAAISPGGKLLDAGCGDGLFLETLKGSTFEPSGLEVSEYAAGYAAERSGVKVHAGTIEDAPFEEGTFDVVTFWHVLEHLPSPLAALQKARRLLKPGGVVIAAVPNLDDRLGQAFYKVLKGEYFQLYTPESKEPHLFHFSAATFRALVEKAGFRVEKLTADFAQVDPYWRVIEYLSYAASLLTGKKIFLALLAVGRK
jgi:2-polyprenyl-3-methyl-5-hydroxy-6-metoxy-1,4-benzoquinol methylase